MTIFVHGFLGSVDDWAPVLERVPGHAVTIPRAASIEAAADALVPAEPCVIVGYSLGGRLAMLAAARNPGAFSAVIAVSADPGRGGEDRTALDAARAEQIEQHGLRSFVDAWYEADLWGPLRAHPAFSAMLERRHRIPSEAAIWALRTYSTGLQPDLWNSLPENLTAVVGGEDPKYLALGDRMGNQGVPVHLLRGAGHAIPIEAPDALAAIVLRCTEEAKGRHPTEPRVYA